MRLENKVALITGAGSGIGRATAIRFAEEGAKVAIADRNAQMGNETARMIMERGGAALFIQADVSKVADTERIVSETVAKFGKLDILVNDAAVIVEKNAVDTTEEEYDRLLGTNLKGTFFCAKHAILQFRRQAANGNRGGAIVNLGSVNSYYAEGGITAYCASKGGIAQLTRALAMDHSGEGIRVNGICPGWIETPLNATFFSLGPDMREKAGRLHAIGRIGQPEEIANAVLFLASDEAAFVTGALLTVDGGFSAGLAPALGIVM